MGCLGSWHSKFITTFMFIFLSSEISNTLNAFLGHITISLMSEILRCNRLNIHIFIQSVSISIQKKKLRLFSLYEEILHEWQISLNATQERQKSHHASTTLLPYWKNLWQGETSTVSEIILSTKMLSSYFVTFMKTIKLFKVLSSRDWMGGPGKICPYFKYLTLWKLQTLHPCYEICHSYGCRFIMLFFCN